MNQPHKHAALIKAWADGAQIQYLYGTQWRDVQKPSWYDEDTYRVKPETKKYRVAMFTWGVSAANNPEQARDWVETHISFVRWLTDWVEYEV